MDAQNSGGASLSGSSSRSFLRSDNNYEVPMVSMDGEPHGTMILVAVFGGIVLAAVILLILITLMEKSRKKLIRSNSNLQAKLSALHNGKASPIPTISQQVAANISRQSSVTSQQSTCSGIVVNGQLHCCHDLESNLVLQAVLQQKRHRSASRTTSTGSSQSDVSRKSGESVNSDSINSDTLTINDEIHHVRTHSQSSGSSTSSKASQGIIMIKSGSSDSTTNSEDFELKGVVSVDRKLTYDKNDDRVSESSVDSARGTVQGSDLDLEDSVDEVHGRHVKSVKQDNQSDKDSTGSLQVEKTDVVDRKRKVQFVESTNNKGDSACNSVDRADQSPEIEGSLESLTEVVTRC